MKIAKMALLALITVGLIFSMAFAAGDAAKGKKMFTDPNLNGAPGPTSCNTCHPDGKLLEKAGEAGRTRWKNPAGSWTSIEDTNNVCLIMAVKGKALDPDSQGMKDLVAYVKSLSQKK